MRVMVTMGYQLFVEFGERKLPTTEDVQKILGGLDQDFAGMEGNLLRATDSYTGDPLSIDVGQSGSIKVEVPFAATFRSIVAAYGLAWALADKFGGKVKDPQLGGTPSLDLARLEWRRHEATEGLARIFGGSVPSDLATRIRQRRGVLSQEVEIQGSDLEIQRRDRGRSVRYFVPILSLGPIQENSVPNPFGILLIIVGMAILFAAGFVGRPLGGDFFVVSIVVIPVSLVVFYKLKRHVLVFPGRGGNLLLESASPSKREVQQFLSSIDRVRFALSRFQPTRPMLRSATDIEDMRVA